MAKAIYVVSRNRPLGSKDEDRLTGICKALTPDNITAPVSHRVSINDLTAYAVMNYQPSNLEKQNSLLLGYLYDRSESWNEPLTDFPDGSYAIFRVNDDYFEAVSDPVASRTVWYYFDEEWFIAATSQRAIIMFLGNFHFNERVIPWMISAGTLGPKLSWDNRIEQIPADSSVVLDRKAWSISTRETLVRYAEQNRSYNEHRELLKEASYNTIDSLGDMDLQKWALTLSGGIDSRAILCMFKKAGRVDEKFQTITWGLEESVNETGNDARVAEDLARALGAGHRFYHTNVSEEPISDVVDRFLFSVEGRSDHLSGYLDGMKIWCDLLEDGITGIIKGDANFGWFPVSSASMVRLSVGCPLCSDYSNLTDVAERFCLPKQEFPADFKQLDESILAWRDRLYFIYRIPIFIAAISDIKFSYIEQISPLLSRLIIERVRELPDKLRIDRTFYKEIVNSMAPEVPFASKRATAVHENILRTSTVVELMHVILQGDYAGNLFSPEFLEWIDKGISPENTPSRKKTVSLKKAIRKLIPRSIKDLLMGSGAVKPKLDANVLAFRAVILIRMHQILSEDCNRVGTFDPDSG